MSDRQGQSRTISSKVLALIGDEASMGLVGLACDFRSGVIPPENYDQKNVCGTACCIFGLLRARISRSAIDRVQSVWILVGGSNHRGLQDLFWGGHPSDPQLAADAIERFVFEGSDKPWEH